MITAATTSSSAKNKNKNKNKNEKTQLYIATAKSEQQQEQAGSSIGSIHLRVAIHGCLVTASKQPVGLLEIRDGIK